METASKIRFDFKFLIRAFLTKGSFLLSVVCSFNWSLAAQSFRLHLGQAPLSLNPQIQKTSASNYLLGNIHRNLMRINANNELVPDLAKICTIQKSQITCELRENLKWSDGSPLTSKDFIESYKSFLNPKTGVTRIDLVETLKGAMNFYNTQKGQFGVIAKNSKQIIFETSQPEVFIYNLASTLLAAVDPALSKFSGPYYPVASSSREKIQLKPNIHYWQHKGPQPNVEFFIIEEDSVALNLFLKGDLDFLRRLPTALIPKYKNSPEFHWIPLLRADYIGFQKESWLDNELRKRLTEALDYQQLQALFHSEGLPGCLGLPAEWFQDNKIPCYQFQKNLPQLNSQSPKGLTLAYSASGGDDHKRAMEWIQNQWKKNLNLNVSVRAIENKTFSADLKSKKHSLFRRGVPIEIPHCGEALKYFTSDHPENFVGFSNKEFDRLIEDFSKKTAVEKKKTCSQAAQILMDSNLIIPLGQIHFSILAKRNFTGWNINSLNQLDLANLKQVPGI